MPRYDDRHSNTRLYIGHLSSRTRSRDLDKIFSRYGRVRDVDMKHDFAFVEFSDARDADDARYRLNGRDVDGSRLIVEFAKGGPRGSGGSRDYIGHGPPPGSGRCFNCGLDGHWARDCNAGDWKNKCYKCGERGHIERNCQNSPKKLRRGRSYSRSPVRSRSPRHGRSRRRSYSRSRTPSRRERSVERELKRSRSYSRSLTPRPSKPMRKHSQSLDSDMSPHVKKNMNSPSPVKQDDMSDYSKSPNAKSNSPNMSPERDNSPLEANGRNSLSPGDDNIRDDENVGSPSP